MSNKWFFTLTRAGVFKPSAPGPYETEEAAQAAADHAATEEGATVSAPFEADEHYQDTLPVATTILALASGEDVQLWSDGSVQELSGE